jgi:hydroxyacyl-ACP dehydratase HTD2-like protein with hotdog domain
LWRDIQYAKNEQQLEADKSLIVPESIAYRATNPLYAEEDYEIVLEEGDEGMSRVNVFNHMGVVSMKADIKA